MQRILLGILLCLLGIAIAIICGAFICNTILDSNLFEPGLANQAKIIIRVMLWSVAAVLDVFFVIVPALNLIVGDTTRRKQ